MIDNDTVATTARQLRLILDAIERGDHAPRALLVQQRPPGRSSPARRRGRRMCSRFAEAARRPPVHARSAVAGLDQGSSGLLETFRRVHHMDMTAMRRDVYVPSREQSRRRAMSCRSYTLSRLVSCSKLVQEQTGKVDGIR